MQAANAGVTRRPSRVMPASTSDRSATFEHDRVRHEAGVFQLFFLLDRITAFDDRATKSDPVGENSL